MTKSKKTLILSIVLFFNSFTYGQAQPGGIPIIYNKTQLWNFNDTLDEPYTFYYQKNNIRTKYLGIPIKWIESGNFSKAVGGDPENHIEIYEEFINQIGKHFEKEQLLPYYTFNFFFQLSKSRYNSGTGLFEEYYVSPNLEYFEKRQGMDNVLSHSIESSHYYSILKVISTLIGLAIAELINELASHKDEDEREEEGENGK